MIKVELLTKLFQESSKYDLRTYGVLPYGVISRARVVHLAEEVLPKFTHQRPVEMFTGELEYLMLRDLYDLAIRVLAAKAPLAPGFALTAAAERARVFAALTEVLDKTQTKLMFEQLSSSLLEKAPIITALVAATKMSEIKAKAGDKSDARMSYTDVIDRLRQMSLTSETTARTAVDAVLFATQDAELLAKEMETLFDRLMVYAGTGPGVPLPPRSRADRISMLAYIEAAISVLINPSLMGGNSPSFPANVAEDDYLMDAYAMLITYLAYLHFTSSQDAYKIAAPPGASTLDARTRVPTILTAARRFAWFYAGISEAPFSFNMLLAEKWLSSLHDFYSLAFDTDFSTAKDLQMEFDKGKTALAASIPSPIKTHFEKVYGTLHTVLGMDVILPPVMSAALPTLAGTSFQKVQAIKVGTSGVDMSSWTVGYATTDMIRAAYRLYEDSVIRFRAASEQFNVKINSFLGVSQFDPNSMNLPSDLFSVYSKIYPVQTSMYRSPYHKELFPVSLRKYVFVDERTVTDPDTGNTVSQPIDFIRKDKYDAEIQYCGVKPRWVLDDYRYAVVNMASLIGKELYPTKGHFVFGTRPPVQTLSTLVGSFSNIPIPYPYVRFAESEAYANTVHDLSIMLRGQTSAITGAFNYFEDLAELLESPSAITKRAIVMAIAGLFITEKKLKNGDWTIDILSEGSATPYAYPPGLRTIYGVPPSLFAEVNYNLILELRKDKRNDAYVHPSAKDPGFVEVTTMTGTTYRFNPIVLVPTPDDIMMIPGKIEDGIYVKMPYLRKAAAQRLKELFSNAAGPSKSKAATMSYADAEDVFAALDAQAPVKKAEYEALAKVISWQFVSAWSRTFSHFPHFTFDYQSTMFDMYGLGSAALDSFRHKSFVRRKMGATKNIEVLATLRRDFFLIEPKDVHKLQEPSPDLGGKPEVVNHVDQPLVIVKPDRTAGPEPTMAPSTAEFQGAPVASGAAHMPEDSKGKGVEVDILETKDVKPPYESDKGKGAPPAGRKKPDTSMGDPKKKKPTGESSDPTSEDTAGIS